MSDSVQNLIAEPEDKGTRIDKYLSQELEDVSRSRIQKLLDDGDITVDDKCVKSNYKLNGTEHITITIPELIVPQILPENIPLNIIYEDDDVILIDKPKGMVVHPAAGHYTGTVVNALMYHCRDNLSGINGVMRPGIVHRIDMNTTGVIVACKNDKAHNDIAAQLAVHSITRKYYCIVHNRFKEEEGTVDAPIGRNPKDRKMMAVDRKNGKRAVTHYRVLENFDKYSFIECQLETGRTHQIRVHMASIGHPILGDDVYCHARSGYKLQGQTLHAGVLGFIHPSTGEYMESKAPLPEYFEKLLKDLRNGYKLNLFTRELSPFLIADHNHSNKMNGNIVNDIFIDKDDKLWMAIYPVGITLFSNKYPGYKWIQHSYDNPNSLIDNQVNSILEDSEGDIWYATSNGICFYNSQNKQWKCLLSTYQNDKIGRASCRERV